MISFTFNIWGCCYFLGTPKESQECPKTPKNAHIIPRMPKESQECPKIPKSAPRTPLDITLEKREH